MMQALRKRALVFGAWGGVTLTILLSACGGGAKAASQSPAPVQSSGGQPPVSPSASGNGGAAQIGTRSISGIGTVLVNKAGFTLYHLPTDTSTKTTCTGGCAQVWPPLLSPNGGPPSSHVAGTFATLTRPDSNVQVTFNGTPLYTFAGDSAPGQANGQGIDGFFAVTTT